MIGKFVLFPLLKTKADEQYSDGTYIIGLPVTPVNSSVLFWLVCLFVFSNLQLVSQLSSIIRNNERFIRIVQESKIYQKKVLL